MAERADIERDQVGGQRATGPSLRIAYVVDVHGKVDSVVGSVEAIGPVDVLIVGGDITGDGTAEQAEQAIERLRPLAPTLLAVAGNMDSAQVDQRLAALGVGLDSRGVVFESVGVGIFGVSAAPVSPLRTPYELAENELGRRIELAASSVASSRIRIFCPHTPPAGTECDRIAGGAHVGSTAVRGFVEREQPELVLCGHIHESRAVDVLGRSRIVNPGPVMEGHYAVVEVAETVVVSLDGH